MVTSPKLCCCAGMLQVVEDASNKVVYTGSVADVATRVTGLSGYPAGQLVVFAAVGQPAV